MTTTSALSYHTKLQLKFSGTAPVFGGNLTFSPESIGNEAGENTATFAKEITFSDLTLETGNYNFRIESDAGSGLVYADGTTPVLNLIGEALVQFEELAMIYVETNATATISGIFSTLPTGLDPGGVLFLHSQTVGDAIVGTGDNVFQLSFSAASVAAIGQANLKARIVIAGTL